MNISRGDPSAAPRRFAGELDQWRKAETATGVTPEKS